MSLSDVIDLMQRADLPHGVVRVGVDGDDGEVVQFCQLTSDVISLIINIRNQATCKDGLVRSRSVLSVNVKRDINVILTFVTRQVGTMESYEVVQFCQLTSDVILIFVTRQVGTMESYKVIQFCQLTSDVILTFVTRQVASMESCEVVQLRQLTSNVTLT